MAENSRNLQAEIDNMRRMIETLAFRIRRNEENTNIRLDGIGSNELTDREWNTMNKIINETGNTNRQQITLKQMIIALAEYCTRNGNQ